jgi:hypothetical protein
MTRKPKSEQTKTKNEEVISLIEQQVQETVDPFASTFNALWGNPLLSGSQKSPPENHVPVQKSTCTNLDIGKNDHSGIVSKEPSAQKTMPIYKHVSITFNPVSQKILKIINQVNNFALIGFITLLNIIYPKGEGAYSVNGLARITGMSRTSIRGNLQKLESFGLLELTDDEIFLSQDCRDWLNPNDNDMYKFVQLPSWEKAQVYSYADDLFYLATVAKTQIEALSMQTLSLYKHILQEHNREYAAALFLLLLPKAKDNPTGYITSAYRQGAEPTTGAILKTKEIFEVAEVFFKNISTQTIKEQIQDALEKDDSETIMRLTQIQVKVKDALKLLSWTGTIEELKGKRDSFIKALLGE